MLSVIPRAGCSQNLDVGGETFAVLWALAWATFAICTLGLD